MQSVIRNAAMPFGLISYATNKPAQIAKEQRTKVFLSSVN